MMNIDTNIEKTTDSDNPPESVPSGNLDSEIPIEYKREIKTYVLRAGRMTTAQEKAYNELSPQWCIPFEHKKLNFIDVFGNTNPIDRNRVWYGRRNSRYRTGKSRYKLSWNRSSHPWSRSRSFRNKKTRIKKSLYHRTRCSRSFTSDDRL